MHASIPLEDQTHEQFWRQLMRWMVDGVPDVVDLRMTDRVEPGEPVQIDARVVDKSFVEKNDATVVAHVTRPGGATMNVPLQWTGRARRPVSRHVRQQRARRLRSDGGRHAGRRRRSARAPATCARRTATAEYFDPVMHAAPLRRIAEETGGRFYTPDTVANMAEDVRYGGRGVTAVEERELWNMPVILLALLALAFAEWGYRRYVGLV